MTDHDRSETTDEDQAFVAGARRLRGILQHPFILGFFAVIAAAVIFRLGIFAGEAVYLAFDGNGLRAAVFGGSLVTTVLAVIAIGVWLDRR